jgi:uncharacterized protein YpiB (UPF0302 family)
MRAALILFFISFSIFSFGQPNGLYLSTKSIDDITVKDVKGEDVKVNLKLPKKINKAFVYSESNTNKDFRIELVYDGKPTNDDRLVLLINNKYYKAWNSGMRRNSQDTYVNYASFAANQEQADEIAKALNVTCNYRKHFGHTLKYEFIPSKQSYKMGDSVWVKFKITNTGSIPVYFNRVELCGNESRSDYFDFDVHYNNEWISNSNSSCYEGWAYKELKPGESDTMIECVNRWSDFKLAGKYTIDCEYSLYLRSEYNEVGYPEDQLTKHKEWKDDAKQTIEIIMKK